MYEILKNRLLNGTPFIKQNAIKRINALANNLEITQEQADELIAYAENRGVDVLPDDYRGRLDNVEATTEELTLAVAAMMGGDMA